MTGITHTFVFRLPHGIAQLNPITLTISHGTCELTPNVKDQIGMNINNINGTGVMLLEMTGPAGLITSSEHPLLRHLIRFSAFSRTPRSSYKGLQSSELSISWLARLQGIAPVAQRKYSSEQRDYHKGLRANWRIAGRRGIQRDPIQRIPEVANVPVLLVFEDLKGMEHKVSIDDCTTWDVRYSPPLIVVSNY